MKNRLYLFWLIGKYVFEKQKTYENIFSKVSNFLSYYYGMSDTFTIYNIKMMRNFYCFFPIFVYEINKLQWEHYLKLLIISDYRERYFYFNVAIFCRSDVLELENMISDGIYEAL